MYISDHIITSKHYLVLFVSFFALGIYLAVSHGIIFSAALCLAAAALTAAALAGLKLLKRLRLKHFALAAVLIFAAFAGVFRIYYFEGFQNAILRQYLGKEVWLCGTVTSDPRLTAKKYYYSFELDVFGIAQHTDDFGTVMLYVPAEYGCDIKAGDNIYAWTALRSPEIEDSSNHFDYSTQLRGRNIFVTGITRNISALHGKINATPTLALKNAGAWVREKITYSIDKLFPHSKILNAVLRGILIGDKSGFDDDLYHKFSYAGISHIVAVSGLHMSILFSCLMLASKGLFVGRRLSLLLTLPAILLFVSASRFTPSVCRAALMISVAVCAALFRKEYSSVTAIFLALGVILFIAPYTIFSKSLVLSFSATLGILVYYPHLRGLLAHWLDSPRLRLKRHKLLKKSLLYLAGSVSLSFATFIGTAYFLAIFFGELSTVQFLTNLWIIPLVSVVFCLGYACCILYYICPWLVIAVLKHPLGWGLEIIRLTVDVFGVPQNAITVTTGRSDGASAIMYFGIALMIYMSLKAVCDFYQEKRLERYMRK